MTDDGHSGGPRGLRRPRPRSRCADGGPEGLRERIRRRRREHFQQVLDRDPAEIAAGIVDAVLITASMIDPDPARRSTAGSLLGARHPTPDAADSCSAGGEPVSGSRPPRRALVAVTTRSRPDSRPGRDRHRVEFDASPGEEQCWGSGPRGVGCSRWAETGVGLCHDCHRQIQGRIDRG